MKFLPATLFFSITSFVVFFSVKTKRPAATLPVNRTAKLSTTTDEQKTLLRLNAAAKSIGPVLKKNNFNREYCFIADMKIPSGEKRFFVYSLTGDSILLKGMVTHGSGSQTQNETLQFSNVPNSLATSLGKYKVGAAYMGKFGLAFKLIGLDKTNNNAEKRVVVLHGHPLVPDIEVAPAHICTSWGCPTVNPAFLLLLQKYIQKSSKPVMLYIFY